MKAGGHTVMRRGRQADIGNPYYNLGDGRRGRITGVHRVPCGLDHEVGSFAWCLVWRGADWIIHFTYLSLNVASRFFNAKQGICSLFSIFLAQLTALYWPPTAHTSSRTCLGCGHSSSQWDMLFVTGAGISQELFFPSFTSSSYLHLLLACASLVLARLLGCCV